MRKLLLWTLFLLLTGGAVQAQQITPPLVGPLIAVNTGDQDQIILYDVGTNEQRSLTFGDGWHEVWGFTDGGCRVLFTLSDGLAPARLYSANSDSPARTVTAN